MDECMKCPCESSEAPYALDAAGQRVHAGDYVMAALPNVPAVHRPLGLHLCRVLLVQKACVKVEYAGSDRRFRKWTLEPFLRWWCEVVKIDPSLFGLSGSDGSMNDESCCGCHCHRYERIECDV